MKLERAAISANKGLKESSDHRGRAVSKLHARRPQAQSDAAKSQQVGGFKNKKPEASEQEDFLEPFTQVRPLAKCEAQIVWR